MCECQPVFCPKMVAAVGTFGVELCTCAYAGEPAVTGWSRAKDLHSLPPEAVAGRPNVEDCRGFGPKKYGIVRVGFSRARARTGPRMAGWAAVIERGGTVRRGSGPVSSQLPPRPSAARLCTRPTPHTGAKHGRRRSCPLGTGTLGGQQQRACEAGGGWPLRWVFAAAGQGAALLRWSVNDTGLNTPLFGG